MSPHLVNLGRLQKCEINRSTQLTLDEETNRGFKSAQILQDKQVSFTSSEEKDIFLERT